MIQQMWVVFTLHLNRTSGWEFITLYIWSRGLKNVRHSLTYTKRTEKQKVKQSSAENTRTLVTVHFRIDRSLFLISPMSRLPISTDCVAMVFQRLNYQKAALLSVTSPGVPPVYWDSTIKSPCDKHKSWKSWKYLYADFCFTFRLQTALVYAVCPV